MPDPTPTPAPAPATPKKTHELVSKADLANVELARSLALAAKAPDLAALFADEEVTPAEMTAIVTDANTAENTLAPAVSLASTAWKVTTRNETKAKKALATFVLSLQGAAKRKFRGNAAKLGGYCIGKKTLGDVREEYEKDVQAMLTLAAGDVLKGFPPAKLAAGATLLAAWKDADDAQQTADRAFAGARGAFKKAVASLNARRTDLQLAVNNGRPHTDPDNAIVRRAFKIPANRPYSPNLKEEPPV